MTLELQKGEGGEGWIGWTGWFNKGQRPGRLQLYCRYVMEIEAQKYNEIKSNNKRERERENLSRHTIYDQRFKFNPK